MVIPIIHDTSDTVLDIREKSLRKCRKLLCIGIIMLYVAAIKRYPNASIRGTMNSGDTFLKHFLLF